MNIKQADRLSQSEFLSLLCSYDQSYFSSSDGEEIISDELYDSLEQLYEKKFGPRPVSSSSSLFSSSLSSKTISPVPTTKAEIVLPFYMGSLKKIRDEKTLSSWTTKYPGPYSITDKVDGVSTLYTFGAGIQTLYTKHRDGNSGTDISYLIPYLFKNHEHHKKGPRYSVRGELVLSKSVFETKYNQEYSNARNMVSGLVNRRPEENLSRDEDRQTLSDLLFVAYHIFDCHLKSSQQLSLLQTLGFQTPRLKMFPRVDSSFLYSEVVARKTTSDYEMDGIVLVSEDKLYPDPENEVPKHSIAFKIQSLTIETTVKKVEWNVSKHGFLKPIVHVHPVRLCGVDISKATGFNARFIEQNNIGKGARILLCRSGDVIPHIVEVISSGSCQPDFPSDHEWKWNETHVDILTLEENSDERIQKRMISFFKQMGVKFLGPSLISTLFEHGYDTFYKLFSLTKDQLTLLPKIKEKSAEKILQSISQSITHVPLEKLMAASGVFGQGFAEKKIHTILTHFPTLMTDFKDSSDERSKWETKLKSIGGISSMARSFVDKITLFQDFLQAHPMVTYRPFSSSSSSSSLSLSSSLSGKRIVLTGTRDKELESEIVSHGGSVSSSVSKKTFCVVKPDSSSTTISTKEQKAMDLQIPIFSISSFRTSFITKK